MIEAEYQSAERAIMDGYRFAFHSELLNADLYSVIVGENSRSFAVIVGY